MSVRITQVENADRSFTLLAEQDVPVSVEEFDRAIGRPKEMGEWFGVEFTWPTSPEHQLDVGSALEFKAPVGPFSVDFILIVADRVPGKSLLLRTTRGAVDMTLEYTWAPTDTGVDVQMRVDFRVRGALWWKIPWTRKVSRHKIVRGLERMRQDVTARSSSGAAVSPARSPKGTRAPEPVVAVRSRPAAAHRKAPRRRCAHQA
ncbi:SRPBCC family protein [Kocuria tytonis]|uniref:SRPBCC family protein n=1 Tax=Kocuria tytonis TaxID=2054280 RepID=A0A495A625_9MICC|nr:hypothetical protein [Kocuria tytonis]RKQ35154.1 hypothetical protein C1C97_007825 [Kocuria tytonis]